MKRHYIIIEHRSSKVEQALRQQLKDAHDKLEKLNREHLSLVHKFGWEVQLNNELIDLCRENNINFRHLLEYSKHPF